MATILKPTLIDLPTSYRGQLEEKQAQVYCHSSKAWPQLNLLKLGYSISSLGNSLYLGEESSSFLEKNQESPLKLGQS